MLFNSGSSIPEIIRNLLLILPTILIALSVHEYCHGYAAYRQGDMTARNLGRLTLNPLKHIDPIGFLCLVFAGFGWAKPVPINPNNFKHYKRGLAIVSLAGPLSNLAMCFLGLVLYRVFGLYIATKIPYIVAMNIADFIAYFVSINVGLFIFNLFPIPPLDGSRIISVLLPQKLAYYYLKYEMYIQIALFALLFFGILSPVIQFLCNWVIIGFEFILNWVPFLKII